MRAFGGYGVRLAPLVAIDGQLLATDVHDASLALANLAKRLLHRANDEDIPGRLLDDALRNRPQEQALGAGHPAVPDDDQPSPTGLGGLDDLLRGLPPLDA